MKWSVSVVLVFLFFSCKNNEDLSIPPLKQVTSSGGLVVSAHPIASQIGADILAQGGNAADAAIA